eukprot:4001690-Amphidinium_carterae.2
MAGRHGSSASSGLDCDAETTEEVAIAACACFAHFITSAPSFSVRTSSITVKSQVSEGGNISRGSKHLACGVKKFNLVTQ